MHTSAATALRRGIASFVANHSEKFVTYSYWLLGIGITLTVLFVAYLIHREKNTKNS